jgi:hypothetical protein
MTAREKFKVNDRACLSDEGKRALVQTHKDGVVRGFGGNGEIVRIQLDGNRSVGRFHMDFWEVIDLMQKSGEFRKN